MCAVVVSGRGHHPSPIGAEQCAGDRPVLQGLADRAPVAASHTRAVLSSEVATTDAPSGLNATLRNASSYYKGLRHVLHCHLQSMHASGPRGGARYQFASRSPCSSDPAQATYARHGRQSARGCRRRRRSGERKKSSGARWRTPMTDIIRALWRSKHYHRCLSMTPTYRWYQLTFNSVLMLKAVNV
jgi:hypothetical protein